jgi:protein disulfide-isomerase A6
LRSLGETFKRNQWSWLWTESNQYPELEEALSVGGFGYPAIAAVNSRKGKFVLLRGSFSKDGINEFLRSVSLGRGSSESIGNGGKLPTISDTQLWDGKDAKLEVEEDIDLSDVVLDDDEDDSMFRRKSSTEL